MDDMDKCLERIAIGLAKKLDSTVVGLKLIQSMCGNPDPSEACRLVIKQSQEMIEDLTLGYGDMRRSVRK